MSVARNDECEMGWPWWRSSWNRVSRSSGQVDHGRSGQLPCDLLPRRSWASRALYFLRSGWSWWSLVGTTGGNYANSSVIGSPPWEMAIGRPVRSGSISLGIDAEEVVHRGDQVAG